MRLHILSDLHLEFGEIVPPIVDGDVVALAGDIAVRVKGVAWAIAASRGRPVIYVPGNHEYYGDSIPRLTEKLRAAGAGSGVHVLDREEIIVDGTRFLGATLWTDFELVEDRRLAMEAAQQSLVDYRRIRVSGSYRKLRPLDTAGMHLRSRRWLEGHAASGHTRGMVIVTHHAPSIRSVRPSFRQDPLSASYASHMDQLVERSGAALWVHGHTHYAVDYVIGDTRVISNPRGYADEPVAGFRDDLVLELTP